MSFLLHRWPTLLGLLVMAQSVIGMADGRDQAVIAFVAALIYLGAALVDRPVTVWILFGASVVALFAIKAFDLSPWPALIGGAVTLVAVALVGDLPGRQPLEMAQIPVMVVVGAVSVAAVSLSPELGGYLAALALIGHGTLDVILWRARKVVVRSMAEFCAALDLTLGAAIIVFQVVS